MMMNRLFTGCGLGRLQHNVSAFSMLTPASRSCLYQPRFATFATKASQVEDVEEAMIITGQATTNRSSESEFHNWLKKDMKSAQAKRVDWKRKKRSVFDKIGFNENHIPHQGNYLKDKKKERLAQWDNPKFDWPPKLPAPSMHKGRALLNHIDSEERAKISKEREFTIPNFRSGDVVELSMFQSISEAKINTFKGLVYGKAKPNNLRSTLWFTSNADGVNFTHKVKLFSPMVARVQILKYGSNKNRKKLTHVPHLDLSKNRLTEPVIRGRGYKPRTAIISKGSVRSKKAAQQKDDREVGELVLEELDDMALKKRKVKLDSADSYDL